MKAKKHAHDQLAVRAPEQQVPPVAAPPRVHWAAMLSLFTGLLATLLAVADALRVYRQYWGIAPKGAFEHLFLELGDFFGLGSGIASLFAIGFGIQALSTAHRESQWKQGNRFALAGLLLGGLLVLLYGLLFSFLVPIFLIAEGGGLIVMLVLFLLRLALRAVRSHPS